MGKIAYIFQGQGSQKVGMGRSLYEAFSEAREAFDTANETLGFDLKTLCFEGPEETLRETENAQVALYVTSVAAVASFRAQTQDWQRDWKAEAFAGHSVGEYAALYAAGALGFADGLKLVRKRGELMRDAGKLNPGTMSAILGLEAEAAKEICKSVRDSGVGLVAVANYNGGGQIVISGEVAAVERVGELAKERGAKRVIPLSVSGPFHSPLMVSAGDALFAELMKTDFRKPNLPVVSNVTANYIEVMDDITGGLTRQVSGSVRWEESVQRLVADGFETFIEFGSGEVLSGLVRRIAKEVKTYGVGDADSIYRLTQMNTD